MTLRQRLSNNRGAIIGLCAGLVVAGATAFLIAKPMHEEIKSLEARRDSARAEVVAVNGGKEPTYLSCALLGIPAVEREKCTKAMDEFVYVNNQMKDKHNQQNNPPLPVFYVLVSIVGLLIGSHRDSMRRLDRMTKTQSAEPTSEQPKGDT